VVAPRRWAPSAEVPPLQLNERNLQQLAFGNSGWRSANGVVVLRVTAFVIGRGAMTSPRPGARSYASRAQSGNHRDVDRIATAAQPTTMRNNASSKTVAVQ